MIKDISTPIHDDVIDTLKVGDHITISGFIYTGRDAALPRLVQLACAGQLAKNNLTLTGGVIFHTAVSCAGIGPTSSNKQEIESSIEPLSKYGIKLHLGKGKLSRQTVEALKHHHAVYAVVPPVSALLQSKVLAARVASFPEEGMEALHLLQVDAIPAIIAVAHGREIMEVNGCCSTV
jgi:fumarate hydratase subunit beta